MQKSIIRNTLVYDPVHKVVLELAAELYGELKVSLVQICVNIFDSGLEPSPEGLSNPDQ